MGKNIHFTSQRVYQFTCEPGKQQTIYMDGKVPGLGLRVTAKGSKSYIFETRLHGRTVRITIGKPETWPLKRAQERASELKVLTDQGHDPRQIEQAQADEQQVARENQIRKEVKVQEAWAIYIAARQKRWSERTYLDHLNHASLGGAPRKKGGGFVEPGPLASLIFAKQTAKELMCELHKTKEGRSLGVRSCARWLASNWPDSNKPSFSSLQRYAVKNKCTNTDK